MLPLKMLHFPSPVAPARYRRQITKQLTVSIAWTKVIKANTPAQLAAMVAQTNTVHEDNTWYVDSGTNQHISNAQKKKKKKSTHLQ